MAKNKRKLTAAEKAAKKRRRQEYMTIFIHGKQKRVRRPPTIDGMDVDEFILRNADPIWLHQNEMWEYIEIKPAYEPCNFGSTPAKTQKKEHVSEEKKSHCEFDDDIPF